MVGVYLGGETNIITIYELRILLLWYKMTFRVYLIFFYTNESSIVAYNGLEDHKHLKRVADPIIDPP